MGRGPPEEGWANGFLCRHPQRKKKRISGLRPRTSGPLPSRRAGLRRPPRRRGVESEPPSRSNLTRVQQPRASRPRQYPSRVGRDDRARGSNPRPRSDRLPLRVTGDEPAAGALQELPARQVRDAPVPSRHSTPSCWLLSLSFNFLLEGCSCKYGAQCRFVHASSQQQPKSNPFGFGTGSKQQQPSSNPFGFGTGSRQQQQQPSSNPFGFGTGSKQQQPSSSPSGVGTGSMQQQPSFGSQFQQQQPQKPNPFGFGVQGGSAQSRNAPGPAKVCVSVGGMELVLTTHSQFLIECVLLVLVCDQWILSNQPFQNKWVRDPSAPTKQSEAAQPPPTAHT
jgi:hypothetical protein